MGGFLRQHRAFPKPQPPPAHFPQVRSSPFLLRVTVITCYGNKAPLSRFSFHWLSNNLNRLHQQLHYCRRRLSHARNKGR